MTVKIRSATRDDANLILKFISDLAEYEKLAHEVVATTEQVETTLFGDQPPAEVVIAEWEAKPAGFALFFTNYSTFLGQPGIYLEDLFVDPGFRDKGIGKELLIYLARLAVDRDCGRLEWSVLDWNEPAIRFYENIGAQGMPEWVQYRLSGDALSTLAGG
jgi:GNAT superfamily N-acetyltransferase